MKNYLHNLLFLLTSIVTFFSFVAVFLGGGIIGLILAYTVEFPIWAMVILSVVWIILLAPLTYEKE
jgi:hypothetical protein